MRVKYALRNSDSDNKKEKKKKKKRCNAMPEILPRPILQCSKGKGRERERNKRMKPQPENRIYLKIDMFIEMNLKKHLSSISDR